MKYVILAVIVAIVLAFFYIKNMLSNFIFGNIKFVSGDLKSLLSGTEFTAINLSNTITNKNNISVSVSGLYIELFYQGVSLGKSTNVQPDFTIPANGSITLTQAMTFNVSSSLNIATKILTGAPVVFDYTIKATIFGFYPLAYSGNFTY